MKIFNTLTGKKEEINPLSSGINLFVCGPTVYDYSHIGHARTYILYDSFVKYLRRKNWRVNYLQNITNIEDKIINRAAKENRNPQEVADFFEQAHYEDMKALGIDSVDSYAPATEYVPEIISQVERLIKKGFAYAAKNSVYFDVRKFSEYGKLSRQKLNNLKEGVRVETEPGKKYFADFALWKVSKPGEPAWDSPWGGGRPGWHIEDTAITEKHFGPKYHIHGGGTDLIFPHHEAEIAQMEALSGLKPLAQIWMHTGMIKFSGEKMSKSLGNIIKIRDFLQNQTPQVMRFLVLASHYRTPLEYSNKVVDMARSSVQRIADFWGRLKEVSGPASDFPAEDFTKDFWKHLDDDFATPPAFAVLFDLIKETNKFIDSHKLSQNDALKIVDFINQVNDIFGILPSSETAPEEITALAAEREKARLGGNYAQSDKIREQIKSLGWNVDDTSAGPRITKRP